MTRTLWIKEPAPTVAVVIVSSSTITPGLALRLKASLQDWDEVAYLQVHEPDALYKQWLTFQGNPGSCAASALLGRLGKHCQLLNIESGQRGDLAWLGSVRGHWLRFLALPGGGNDEEHQCKRVLDVLRELVRHQLAERYPAC